MGTTPTYGLRYQELTDPPHGPDLGKNLATDVEAQIARLDALRFRATQTLATTTASVTFSVPSNVRRLVVSWTVRATAAAVLGNLWMRVNGSTAASYNTNLMRVNNTTQSNTVEVAVTRASIGVITAASSAANNFGTGEVTIVGWHAPHPSLNFTFQSHAYESQPNSWHVSGGGLYFAAGPYNSLTFLPDVGSFAAGSDFTLLGWT